VHRLARAYFLAIMNRPLLRGFILADADLLGRLANPRGGGATDDRHRLMSRTYFELLAQHGLLRDDLDVDAIAYAFQATFEGFCRRRPRRSQQRRRPSALRLVGTSGRTFSHAPYSKADGRSLAARCTPSRPLSSTYSPISPTPTAPTSASPKRDRPSWPATRPRAYAVIYWPTP
jgi:hypothetical protein